MQRGSVAMIGLLLAVAVAAEAAPRVLGPDDRPRDRATVVADAGAFWVRDGADLPVLVTPDADDQLRLPELPVARLLVLDATTRQPLSGGRLRWSGSGVPDALSTVDWSAPRGRLDVGCRGGEPVELAADGYRPITVSLEPGPRRTTVLLEPRGDLELAIQPPAAGRLWLAATDEITPFAPFHTAAAEHPIGADGVVTVRDLDAGAGYHGVVVIPGRAPVVGRIGGLPLRLELATVVGLAASGRVVDDRDVPVAGARVSAIGRLDELGGFRYRQQGRTDAEGRFRVGGLLAGEIVITACAPGRACSEATLSLGEDGAEPVELRLAPGHDLRLVVRDEVGRPAAGATVIETEAYRRHETDDAGTLLFEGVEPGDSLELEISGAGLRPWRGRVDTDLGEVVLRIPTGGAIEWPVLTQRRIEPADVVATWTRLDGRGREVADGAARWDAELRLVRADGLDTGPHRLELRLPGAATLRSEVVEVGPGDELQLAAVVPERGLAIAGRLLDGDTYRPVAGARISCEPGSPHAFRKPQLLDRLATAVSDADGVFLLEGLDRGACRAVVRAAGYAAWRRDGVEPDEAGADLGDIELDQGMGVVGRVVDRSGRPQAGVAVEITENAAYAYLAEATVRTDHDGWFRAAALPAGAWVVRAQRGEQTARAEVEGRAGDTASVELRLGGLRLEGEVWIGDRPAAGGHLVLTTDGAVGDGVVVMVQTDADQRRFFGVDRPPLSIAVAADGRFASDGVEPGAYTASYTPPGSGGAPVSRELVVPQTELHRCLIRFSDAGIEGIVVDPDGLPVTGAAIVVGAPDGRPLANGFSDGDGNFHFIGLDAGVVRVGAVHSGFGDADPVEVELRAGETAGPLTVELRPPDGAELALNVHSAAGSLAGAPVYLVGTATLTGFTDGAGLATFTGVEPGRYRPCAAAYGGAAGCGPEITLDDGDQREQVLELGGGGRIEVLLGPMERAPSLRLLTADGIDLTSMLMMVSPPVPGPDGVRLGPLTADDYRVTVAMSEGLRQGDVAAVDGETVVLDLR